MYDPEEDECIEGATATLTDLETADKFTAETDSFGDFWFENVKLGTYFLTIEKDGYYAKEIESISTEKDVNLGDIKLYKKA